MALLRQEKVDFLILHFADGTTEEFVPDKPATYRVSENGTKLGDKPAGHWVEHEILWRSDEKEGVGP